MQSKIDLIAYCGLYCPKCYKMKISEAAEKLVFELESAQGRGAKYLQEDPLLKEKIDKLVGLKCQVFCRADQDNSSCVIKNCCCGKGLSGCWECEKMGNCKKLNPHFLENNKKIKNWGLINLLNNIDKKMNIKKTIYILLTMFLWVAFIIYGPWLD